MNSLTRFIILFLISSVLGILILINRSSSETEDKSTNVKQTSLGGSIILGVSIAILVISRITTISEIKKNQTGYEISFGKETVMFLSSFILVFCAAMFGVVIVFARHMMKDMYYLISIGLIFLSVLFSGWLSSRVDTFDRTGLVLLVLTAGCIIGAGVTLNMVKQDEYKDLAPELQTSFSDLPKVTWSIGGATILCLIGYGIYLYKKGNQSQGPLPASPSAQQQSDVAWENAPEQPYRDI